MLNDWCPHCKNDRVILVREHYPWHDDHLTCRSCGSTFNLDYKPLWLEDVNSISVDVIDLIEDKLKERNITADEKWLDNISDIITEALDKYSTGDYRQHH